MQAKREKDSDDHEKLTFNTRKLKAKVEAATIDEAVKLKIKGLLEEAKDKLDYIFQGAADSIKHGKPQYKDLEDIDVIKQFLERIVEKAKDKEKKNSITDEKLDVIKKVLSLSLLDPRKNDNRLPNLAGVELLATFFRDNPNVSSSISELRGFIEEIELTKDTLHAQESAQPQPKPIETNVDAVPVSNTPAASGNVSGAYAVANLTMLEKQRLASQTFAGPSLQERYRRSQPLAQPPAPTPALASETGLEEAEALIAKWRERLNSMRPTRKKTEVAVNDRDEVTLPERINTVSRFVEYVQKYWDGHCKIAPNTLFQDQHKDTTTIRGDRQKLPKQIDGLLFNIKEDTPLIMTLSKMARSEGEESFELFINAVSMHSRLTAIKHFGISVIVDEKKALEKCREKLIENTTRPSLDNIRQALNVYTSLPSTDLGKTDMLATGVLRKKMEQAATHFSNPHHAIEFARHIIPASKNDDESMQLLKAETRGILSKMLVQMTIEYERRESRKQRNS